MIDITPYQQRLEWLKEWMHKNIDTEMGNQVVLRELKWDGKNDLYLDLRNFKAFVRHKTRQYTNGWLRSKYINDAKIHNG